MVESHLGALLVVVVGATALAGAALLATAAVRPLLLAAAPLLALPASLAWAGAVAWALGVAGVVGRTDCGWTRTRRRRAQTAEAVPRAEVTRATLSGVVSRLVVRNAQSAGGLLELSDAEADAVLAWTIAIPCAAGGRTDRSYLRTDALNALAVRHVGTEQTCWREQQSPTDTAISLPSSPIARPIPSWRVGRSYRRSLPGRTCRTQPHFQWELSAALLSTYANTRHLSN